MFQAIVLVGMLLIATTTLVAAWQMTLARRELEDSRALLQSLLSTLRERL